MINEELQLYISKLVPARPQVLEEMERYAKEHNVPIMDLVGIEAMLQILKIKQPNHILEIGTAIGYSALRMAYALPDSKIVTVERDEERLSVATDYIEQAGRSHQISIVKGDALELAEKIQLFGPFDVIFIDAAKGQYRNFFELYSNMLTDDGIIITDNVLFKGLVTNTEIENRNIRSLVKKINQFNHWIMDHSDYDTSILPIGDGIAISKKR